VKKHDVETRRIEILDTTCEVVIERGFAATRIGDVAKRLNVSNSLIHYHFDSKESLLAEAFAHYARKDLAEMEAYIQAAPTATERLARLIQNYVPVGSDDLEWMLWIDAWGEALRNPLMKRISQELDDQSMALLQQVLDDGVSRGEFTCADTSVSALRITGLIDGLAVQYAAHRGVLTRESLLDTVTWLASNEVKAEIPVDLEEPGLVENVTPVTLVSATVDDDIRRTVHSIAARLNLGDASHMGHLLTEDCQWTVVNPVDTSTNTHWTDWVNQYDGINVGLVSVTGSRGRTADAFSIVEAFRRTSEGQLDRSIWQCHDAFVLTGQGWRLHRRNLTAV